MQTDRLPHQTVRERLEADERARLSPLATFSDEAQRERPEEESTSRTSFQRDRDRILHTKAFRRLKHKTQVFISPEGDHYRTRLTHTLEVTQIARTITRALRLNEDLTEAIGLGHDLGHAPFGHSGEKAIAQVLGRSFRHNQQSLRIVEVLEKNGSGLNLTSAVRDGITFHSKAPRDISSSAWGMPATLEGQIIKISDSVAYINHDIDDALRAGVLQDSDLPQDLVAVLGRTHATRINTMVCDLIDTNWWATGAGTPPDEQLIAMSPDILAATNGLRDFMFKNVYLASPAQDEDSRVGFVIEQLYNHFIQHPEDVPEDLRGIAQRNGDPIEMAVIDYIAGMTDPYALKVFHAIYVPRSWSG